MRTITYPTSQFITPDPTADHFVEVEVTAMSGPQAPPHMFRFTTVDEEGDSLDVNLNPDEALRMAGFLLANTPALKEDVEFVRTTNTCGDPGWPRIRVTKDDGDGRGIKNDSTIRVAGKVNDAVWSTPDVPAVDSPLLRALKGNRVHCKPTNGAASEPANRKPTWHITPETLPGADEADENEDEDEDLGLLHPDQERRVAALYAARDVLGDRGTPTVIRYLAKWILDGTPDGGDQA